MAIIGDRWIDEYIITNTVRAYGRDEIVSHGITAGQMAIKHAGSLGIRLPDALRFAGHLDLARELDDADIAVDRARAALQFVLDLPHHPSGPLDLFAPFEPEPEWVVMIRAHLDRAEAARASVFELCRPIVEEAHDAGGLAYIETQVV